MHLFNPRIVIFAIIISLHITSAKPIAFFYPIYKETTAYANEKASFSDKEIQDELYAERDLIHYMRLSGLLTDMLREQKRVFFINKGAAENGISLKVEEFLNEASILASEEMYDESFKIMEKAFYIMSESLKEMNGD